MLPDDKAGLLLAFLGGLPSDIAMRLARAVEVDRLMDGKALPHDVILQGLRPVLRNDIAHNRTWTPLRLFCRPFEDLLSSTIPAKKLKASIARTSVPTLWLWISCTLLPEQTPIFAANRLPARVQKKGAARALASPPIFWDNTSALISATKIGAIRN